MPDMVRDLAALTSLMAFVFMVFVWSDALTAL